ncbi:alpha-N-acetylglucosaminidase isoform X1 [Brachionus plicatilis]|uniref:Alpha-N-acetylglucosaminidase isoform X1 n=1 Tax=Brachionus plicatilis TaxID=10195 RepID=A0A3M7R277_BRAPC|nr:alpha-N-acetylglucosaminidase isoform X1 [Brachionus plicatilis]
MPILTKHFTRKYTIIQNQDLNSKSLDSFELSMVQNDKKLLIRANSAVAAAWGFNYYLKYYTNSSVFWSGKNINLDESDLPIVRQKIQLSSKDFVRFYQNICTFSYSYVWWDWSRWQYEIDWMALNGINMVYAQTAAEYPWIKVSNGYRELGISYVLPAFAGFVPDQIRRIYPFNNFTSASDWIGLTMVDPLDPLFSRIGIAYNREVIRLFGPSGFYSADVFNEMLPKSGDLDYLAIVNQAVYDSLIAVDENAIWVMQGWVFNQDFWNRTRVEAFLSRIPIGRLIILDLFSETIPHFNDFSSYFGHSFVWNMLHNFGGANGIFGDIEKINQLPDKARKLPNSSMIGVGITMEGIDQNEMIYEFMLEKTWRQTLNQSQFSNWVLNYAARRYMTKNTPYVDQDFQSILGRIIINYSSRVFMRNVIYRTYDYQNKQLFTKRPSFNIRPEGIPNLEQFYSAWDDLVQKADDFAPSALFRYDLIDFSKEVLRYFFDSQYSRLKNAWNQSDLYKFRDLD